MHCISGIVNLNYKNSVSLSEINLEHLLLLLLQQPKILNLNLSWNWNKLKWFACNVSDWWNYLYSILGNVVFYHEFLSYVIECSFNPSVWCALCCVWLIDVIGVSVRCLEYLLRNDANPALRDKDGYSAVHYASAYGHRVCLELVSMSLTHGMSLKHSLLQLCLVFAFCFADCQWNAIRCGELKSVSLFLFK